ncbi:hypothetical protein [Streptomyces sp. NPDC047868]|uniref:hypothetical protein n=1 Tax=Streptomyces sp. NPDC047868 TaxID=3155480 RepID=UPI003452E2CD
MRRTPARRIRSHPPLLHHLRTPMARWGFTILALLAAASDQMWPFFFTAALATYGWRTRPRRRTRR